MGVLSKISINRVLLLLVFLTFAAAALPFISYAPNRLVSGEGRQLWEVWPNMAWGLAATLLLLVVLCIIPGKSGSVLTLVVVQLLVIAAMYMAVKAATNLAQT